MKPEIKQIIEPQPRGSVIIFSIIFRLIFKGFNSFQNSNSIKVWLVKTKKDANLKIAPQFYDHSFHDR